MSCYSNISPPGLDIMKKFNKQEKIAKEYKC
jgi:hypothetical protein